MVSLKVDTIHSHARRDDILDLYFIYTQSQKKRTLASAVTQGKCPEMSLTRPSLIFQASSRLVRESFETSYHAGRPHCPTFPTLSYFKSFPPLKFYYPSTR